MPNGAFRRGLYLAPPLSLTGRTRHRQGHVRKYHKGGQIWVTTLQFLGWGAKDQRWESILWLVAPSGGKVRLLVGVGEKNCCWHKWIQGWQLYHQTCIYIDRRSLSSCAIWTHPPTNNKCSLEVSKHGKCPSRQTNGQLKSTQSNQTI